MSITTDIIMAVVGIAAVLVLLIVVHLLVKTRRDQEKAQDHHDQSLGLSMSTVRNAAQYARRHARRGLFHPGAVTRTGRYLDKHTGHYRTRVLP